MSENSTVSLVDRKSHKDEFEEIVNEIRTYIDDKSLTGLSVAMSRGTELVYRYSGESKTKMIGQLFMKMLDIGLAD